MSASDNINNALKEILARLNPGSSSDPQDSGGKGDGTAGTSNGSAGKNVGLNPSQVLIISAMLAGVLEVTSVLVDRNQTVEIVLTGSLRRKTDLEKMLDQIGSKSFDEVVKAMLGRLYS